MVGTAVSVFVLGTVSAWLVTAYNLPGRKFLQWGLLLPFAMPSYVVAFVYTEFYEFSGPIQTMIRYVFGYTNRIDYYFPEIRSLGGAIFILSIVLYPYVYMLARASFSQQSVTILESGRVLGRSPWQCFYALALPLSRPAIVTGIMLAMMETLNDFGTISLFGVHTLTSGIYDIWLGMNDVGSAAQIAVLMLIIVFGLLYIEMRARKSNLAFSSNTMQRTTKLLTLSKGNVIFACIFCYGLILIGFIIPAGILVDYSIRFFDIAYTDKFLSYSLNSLIMALISAFLVMAIGIFLAYGLRLNKSRFNTFMVRISCLGYATPGAVLAIGVLIPLAWFDNTVDGIMRSQFDISTGLLLSGGMFILIYAYTVRFMNIGFGASESALMRITNSMDNAGRVFGQSPLGVLGHIHLPIMKSGILAGAIIVFVDTMKELSSTLLLRPFNFETLATYVYQFASDELIEQASLGALVIVATGIIPVIVLSSIINKK